MARIPHGDWGKLINYAARFTTDGARGVLAGGTATSIAQETTGTPGSPEATTTIDGRYLPPPQPFQGEIKLNALKSKPAWPARVVAPKGAQLREALSGTVSL